MRRFVIIAIAIVCMMYIDFISKWFFENGIYQSLIAECPLAYHPDCLWKYYPIFGEYFGFQLFHNSWIAFSLPITGTPLQIITILLVGVLIYTYFHYEYPKKQTLLDIGYTMILAWAFSHAYERIFIWHVVDFISVKYFAILNFADIFISVWAFFIIVYYVFFESSRRG